MDHSGLDPPRKRRKIAVDASKDAAQSTLMGPTRSDSEHAPATRSSRRRNTARNRRRPKSNTKVVDQSVGGQPQPQALPKPQRMSTIVEAQIDRDKTSKSDAKLKIPASIQVPVASEEVNLYPIDPRTLSAGYVDHLPVVVPDPILPAVGPKPKLPRLPPIWAKSRQEICEGFDWFRHYQGGIYHADNAVKGYLLGGYAAKRDVFKHDGKFIISHGGGKSEAMRSCEGQQAFTQASDQLSNDRTVQSLLENYRTGRQLVIIIDDKYSLFPFDLSAHDVTYAVLGFYTIVYAWAEYQPAKTESGRVVRYKFAFQWCEEQGLPWWIERPAEADAPHLTPMSDLTTLNDEIQNDDALSISSLTSEGPVKLSEHDLYTDETLLHSQLSAQRKICEFCHVPSPTVYTSWFCLEPTCEMFWRSLEDKQLIEDPGGYRPGFLRLMPSQSKSRHLRIEPLSFVGTNLKMSTRYPFTRGVFCPRCGRISCRSHWEKLVCLNCSWQQKVEVEVQEAKHIWFSRLSVNFNTFQLNPISNITYCPEKSFPFRVGSGRGARGIVQTFVLPENRGKLHHIRSNLPTGMKEADSIFEQYQIQANSGRLKFRSWPLRAHKCRGTLLTNYFSHNTGEPYQYVGGDANTVSFKEAPVVSDACNLIERRIKEALGITTSFNEVLSCAYMERQKMAFHSDAEVGLGPLVAGLSLGSPALMHFRVHAKHDPLLQQRRTLLTFVLRHGDILVMDGSGVQEYYEHTVIPTNFRIAATARQITNKHHAKKD